MPGLPARWRPALTSSRETALSSGMFPLAEQDAPGARAVLYYFRPTFSGGLMASGIRSTLTTVALVDAWLNQTVSTAEDAIWFRPTLRTSRSMSRSSLVPRQSRRASIPSAQFTECLLPGSGSETLFVRNYPVREFVVSLADRPASWIPQPLGVNQTGDVVIDTVMDRSASQSRPRRRPPEHRLLALAQPWNRQFGNAPGRSARCVPFNFSEAES